MKFDNEYAMIPASTQGAIERYVEHKIPPGSFVRAVLENNLMEAFSRADTYNTLAMATIAKFVYNRLPIGCHGSPEIVKEWLESNNEL